MLAVIDLETTGLGKSDRIVEIGVVWLSENGEIVDSFETLINPLRDIGPTSIHGVTASMVSAAPTFDDIAGHISGRLEGCVLAAHNLSFDSRMLCQEYARLDATLLPGQGICTLRATGERLAVACDRMGIVRSLDHSAGSDAMAAAELLVAVGALQAGGEEPVHVENPPDAKIVRSLTRTLTGARRHEDRMVACSRSAHLSADGGGELAYCEALDHAMLDGYVSELEATELAALASDFGLSSHDVTRLHHGYLKSLTEAVARDGVVTEEEHELMRLVANGLGLTGASLPEVTKAPGGGSLLPGMAICFTGDAVDSVGNRIDRSTLEEIAVASGLSTVPTVTKKKCDALVASDPNSASGKAAKARAYEKPIFSVDQFLQHCSGAGLAANNLRL